MWMFSWLPILEFPQTITDGWLFLVGTLWSFDWLLPIGTLITLFQLTVGLEILVWVFDILHWIYKKIRGS